MRLRPTTDNRIDALATKAMLKILQKVRDPDYLAVPFMRGYLHRFMSFADSGCLLQPISYRPLSLTTRVTI